MRRERGRALALAAPSSASAATLGETFPNPGACSANTTYLQAQSPGASYEVPSPGVITEWSHHASASPPPQMKLKVGRPAGGSNYTIVGESALETITPGVLNTFSTNIPVQAGDVIGFYISANGQCARVDPTFTEAFNNSDVPPGTTAAFTEENFQLDVAAEFEPYRCAGRDATIAGTDGDDSITATNGDDSIVGLAGDDEIGAAGGEDCVSGDAGNDVLRGGAGHDLALGGDGNDKLRGQNGRDKLKGDAGKDRVNGGNGKDVLKGGPGKDKLRGAGAKDKIKGNAGADQVGAQDGKKDRINCGGGNDRAVVDPIDRVKNCETVKVVDAD